MGRKSSFSALERDRLIQLKGTTCINCSKNVQDNIIFHHVIPLTIGGTNKDSNIVPLCEDCHNKLHNITKKDNSLSHSDLIKVGIEKAKKQGIHTGRKLLTKDDIPNIFKEKYYPMIKKREITITQASKEIPLSRTSIYKYIKILEEENLI